MTAPSLQAIREAMAAQIMTNTEGLVGAFDTVVEVARVPCIVVEPDSATYLIGGGNCSEWMFCVYVLISRSDAKFNQHELDAYITPTGPRSVPAAIKVDDTLGLPGVDVTLLRMSGYGGHWTAAAVPHIGACLHVKVLITQ